MAGNPPSDGSGDRSTRTSKKRGAGKDGEGQGPTQKPRRSIWNLFASSEPEYDPEEDLGSPTPSPPPPTTEERAEHQRRTARLIDAHTAATNIKRIVQTAKATDDPFNPEITETDDKWIKKRKEVVELFQETNNTVLTVLEKLGIQETSFQGLQLLPPKTQDLALELQRENTELYKKALGAEGRFKNTHDNLATKLTMLYFGLPIEPLTYKNVVNCHLDAGDDPEDDEAEIPRVQRILYSEKPLEFLDCYLERSFGFPMLRRPKIRAQNMPQPVGGTPRQLEQISIQHGNSGHHHRRQNARMPVQPTGSPLRLRGGGGDISNRYLYSRYGASIKLKAIDNQVSADEFRKAALKALDLHPDSDWTIVVDQFENSERYRNTAIKPFVRSFIVSKNDFEKRYESYLKSRISNRQESWALSVDYYHLRMNGEKYNGPFSIPVRASNNGDVLNLARLPKDRPPKHKDANHLPSAAPAPVELTGKATSTVFAYPSKVPQPFEDNAKSFTHAIKTLFPGSGARSMTVSLYSRQLDNIIAGTAAPLDHTILFPLTANLQQYIPIQKRIFQEIGWTAVVHETIVKPPSHWPPGSKPPSASRAMFSPRPKPIRAIALIYRNNQGRETKPTSISFSNRALSLLGMDPNSDWEFSVDLYSNELNRVDGGARAFGFSHTVQIRKASLEKQFVDDIQPRLFRGEADWNIVVRPSDEDPVPSFTPFDVLTVPPSRMMPPPRMSMERSPGQGTPGSKPTTSPTISTGPAYIYGYGGQVKVEKNAASFQTGALALLGLANADGWTFTVDLHHTTPPTVIDVSAATISDKFERFIKRVPGNPESYPWPVFVRKCNKVSTKDLVPRNTTTNYVVLRGDDRESYWKLPTPRDCRYGMNQIQDSFFAAMLVHYPLGSPRPSEDVSLLNTHLGFGGMEITEEFYNAVKKQIDNHSADGFAVCDGVPRPSTASTTEIGIRLAGTERYSTFQRGDFAGLARALRELSRTVLLDHDDPDKPALSLPDNFRVWFTAEKRENNVGSHLFDFSHNSDLAGALKSWLQGEDLKGSTNCIWFRPEWKQFIVSEQIATDAADMDLDDNQGELAFQWDATSDSTLKSFRTALATPFNDDDDGFTDNFEIIVAKRSQRFVVNSATTEEQWRKHIFDYFHNNELKVIRNGGIQCIRDSSDPWGIFDMPVNKQPVQDRPKTVPGPPIPVSPRVRFDTGSNGNRSGNCESSGGPPSVTEPAYEPRRIPGAKPPIFRTSEVPKFDKWMLNHTAQNTLQQRSWTQDQSVIEPGYAPAAPLYGDNFELAITVGPSLPTVFIQHLTPTDIVQLRKENRKLLNHVLEREIGCPICQETFKAYDNDAKVAHYRSHMDVLNSIGKCPMCEEEWSLFTIAQKKEHLLGDFTKRESEDIKQFWDDTRCPICNLDFKSKSAEDVTTHIASHVPGALKFCDRCGFDMLACTPPEKAHHDRICTRKTPVREPGAPDPILCQNCGRERTPASEKRREHDVCGNGYFCVRCGLNLALLGPQEQHTHFKRCRVPSGASGKHCKRCGKHLASLSALGLASHNNECYRREPASVAAANDTIELSQAVEQQRIKNATDRADILHRQAKLRVQEQAILAREKAILKSEQHNQIDNPSHDKPTDPKDNWLCPFDGCRDNISIMSDIELAFHFNEEHVEDSPNFTAGTGAAPSAIVDEPGRGTCPLPGCTAKFGNNNSLQAIGAHLRWHANDLADHGRITDMYDMRLCPIQGCGFRLGIHPRVIVRDHFQTHAGLVPPTGAVHADTTDMGHCPVDGCQQVLGNMTRQQMVNHFATHTAGNSTTEPCTFQCPFSLTNGGKCSVRLSLANDGADLLNHYKHDGEQVSSGPACHSAALNAALAEFKRRLPGFREAHATLQKLADTAEKAGTQFQRSETRPHRTQEEQQAEEQERAAIVKASNLLGVKQAKEQIESKAAGELIRKLRGDTITFRAELAQLEEANPVLNGLQVPDDILAARAKVAEADKQLRAAARKEEQRMSVAAVALGQAAAELAARKQAINFDGNSGGGGGVHGGNGWNGGGGGRGGGNGPPGPPGGSGNPGGPSGPGGPGGPPDGTDQTGFLPSPPRPSFKKLPTLRRTRSVKGRAPITGSKRKKAAMDDSEDTMSNGFSNLTRSPSKRETKKMRMGMAGERMGGGNPEMMRRWMVIEEEGESAGGESVGGEAGLASVPRRATRGMSAAAPRKVGRPRKMVREEVEDDDGFEDVEEEEDEDEEMPARGTPKRARK